jgi:hypothetical protein
VDGEVDLLHVERSLSIISVGLTYIVLIDKWT